MNCTMISEFTIPFQNLIQLLLWLIKLHPINRKYPPFGTLDIMSMCHTLATENPSWITLSPNEYSLDIIHILPRIWSTILLIPTWSDFPQISDLMSSWITWPWQILPWMSNILRYSIMGNTFPKENTVLLPVSLNSISVPSQTFLLFSSNKINLLQIPLLS